MKKSIENANHYKWGENADGWRLHDSETLTVISERMDARTSEVLHYHATSQQVFYVLSGEATFEVGPDILKVGRGESLAIPTRTLHKISNETDGDLSFLVISEPAIRQDRIEVLQYSEEFKTDIRRLNYEWLEKYFKVEDGDARSLSNPKEMILDKGGSIWFVRLQGQIVGTVSLLRKSEEMFEVGKMAVSSEFQGLGIGNVLVKHCIDTARKRGIKQLILYSNTRLENAIHLYRKFGFVEIPLESGLYERANIKMSLSLK